MKTKLVQIQFIKNTWPKRNSVRPRSHFEQGVHVARLLDHVPEPTGRVGDQVDRAIKLHDMALLCFGFEFQRNKRIK